MDRKVFNKIKNFTSGGIKLSHIATWALWDEKDIKNLGFIEKNVDKLNGNFVFVALNFGGKKLPVDWKDWQNIHGVKRVRDLLINTRFEGAYITDLIKNTIIPSRIKTIF